MALSNTATPIYYGRFREAVMRGEIPVCREISMEMNRIDDLIANPGVYYDDKAVNGFIKFCERELTLTDGSDLKLLDSFKLWAEEIFGWYYFVERSVYVPEPGGHGGHYERKRIKKRLITKQYLIITRAAAKTMYLECLQAYFMTVDKSTTQQVTTAPTMKQAEEVLSPFRTALARARGPVFKFMTMGSIQNTTGAKSDRVKMASTKKGIENFLTGSLLEIFNMMDAARYQGNIDWDAVKASGKVDCVLLKTVSTNSKLSKRKDGLYIDPTFERNYAECKRVGLPVGVYYYTYATTKAMADAELAVLKTALAGKTFEMPVCVDVEDNKLVKLNKGSLTALVDYELRTLESWNVYALLYTGLNFSLTRLNMAKLKAYDVWVAAYRKSMKKPATSYKYGIWQYTDEARIPGVRTNADMSYAYKDYPAIIERAGLSRVKGA